MAEEKKVNIFESHLVPKHELLSEDKKAEVLKKLNISVKQLPRIKKDDPAIKPLKAKKADVIKITRESPTAEKEIYYRVVIE